MVLNLRQLSGPVAVGVLLVVPFVVFFPIAFVDRAFFAMDLQFYFYPYHRAAADLISSGSLPLWNPLTSSGLPLLGDGQTALLYPPNWLFLLFPGAAALNFDILLQFCIAGLGAYLAARSLGAGPFSAMLGGLAYMLGGFMTARVIHLSIQSGAAMIPWVFLCSHHAFRRSSARWVAAAAFAVALQMVTGHPQIPVYTAAAMALLAAVVTLEYSVEGFRRPWRPMLLLVAIYALGCGLAALQLLPWFELASLSPRAESAGYEFIFKHSMTIRDWLLLLFPYLRGSIGAGVYGAETLPSLIAVELWERTAYVGILPLALAAIGLLGLVSSAARAGDLPSGGAIAGRRRWFSLLYLGLLVLSTVLFAAGKHTPLAAVVHSIPVVGSLRGVARVVALTSFALTMLAALGMQSLLEQRTRLARGGVLGVAVALVLVPAGIVLLAGAPWFQSWLGLAKGDLLNLAANRPNTYVPLLLTLINGALLFRWCFRAPSSLSQAAAFAVLLFDVGSFAAFYHPTTDASLYATRPAAAEVLSRDAEPHRKLTVFDLSWDDADLAQRRLSVSWGMPYGIEDANGFNSLQTRRYMNYMFGPDATDVSYGALLDPRILDPRWPIPHALNVKYLLFPERFTPAKRDHLRLIHRDDAVSIFENTLVLPRAYFVDSVRSESDPQKILETVTALGFDGRREAFVEDPLPRLEPAAVGRAEVAITTRSANRIELTTSTSSERLLVLSEMYFPGWRAFVGGVETEIHRANYLFRAIVVPAGEHRLEFVYRPRSVAAGLTLSTISLAILLWLIRPLCFDRRRSQRSGT